MADDKKKKNPEPTPDQKKSEKEAADHAPKPAKGEEVAGQPGTGEGDAAADTAPESVGDGPSGGAEK